MGSAGSVDSSNQNIINISADEDQDPQGRRGAPSPSLSVSSNLGDDVPHPSKSSNNLPGSHGSIGRSQGSISHSQENVSHQGSISHSNLQHSPRNTAMTGHLPTISPTISINESQQAVVRECLATLEGGFVNSGVHLNADHVLPYVETVTRTDDSIVEGEALLKDNGLYIVQEGLLDLCAADGRTVSHRLQVGDFFGELSTLFRVANSAVVNVVSSKVTLLHIPADSVRECVSVDEGGKGFSKDVMMNWCVKKSYLESCEVFGHGVLAQKVVSNCLKASVLSDLTVEAVNFIAELATPMLFDPGDVIYSSGEEAGYILLVLRGGVELSCGSEIISNRTVKYSDEGYCLCHREFFSGAKLSHEARASSPLTISSVSKEVLLEMVNKFPNEISKLKFLLNTYKRSR